MPAAQQAPPPPPVGPRRLQRRQETLDTIVALAVDVMTERGVGGLTLAEVARRLGVQPPSLYKYFPSLLALYDELFRRGQQEHLDAVQQAIAAAPPGMRAVSAGVRAGAEWSASHPVLSQLLFWRPVAGYEPSAEAFAPSIAMVEHFRASLKDAVAEGELDQTADSDDALALLSVVATGLVSQHLANDPAATASESRFLRLIDPALAMFANAYRPSHPAARAARRAQGDQDRGTS